MGYHDHPACLPPLPILVRVAGWALAVVDHNGDIVTDDAVKKSGAQREGVLLARVVFFDIFAVSWTTTSCSRSRSHRVFLSHAVLERASHAVGRSDHEPRTFFPLLRSRGLLERVFCFWWSWLSTSGFLRFPHVCIVYIPEPTRSW